MKLKDANKVLSFKQRIEGYKELLQILYEAPALLSRPAGESVYDTNYSVTFREFYVRLTPDLKNAMIKATQ
jgi:hypothetical protein